MRLPPEMTPLRSAPAAFLSASSALKENLELFLGRRAGRFDQRKADMCKEFSPASKEPAKLLHLLHRNKRYIATSVTLLQL
jgi:hypothetical protein